MLSNTDLDKVKEKARALLYLDLRIMANGLFVQHPYFSSTICVVKESGETLKLDLNNESDLKKARRNIEKTIAEVKDYNRFLMLIRSPYLPVFFSLTERYLSIKDFSEFLASMWTYIEFPNADPNVSVREFISLFRKADRSFLMEIEDRKVWNSLPDKVIVYRGVNGQGRVKSLSWSLSEEKARWFANRWHGNGKVYTATIAKADIFAYFSNRGEDEVVLDCNKLCNICEV